MLAILITIRDFLIVAALAWVGVSMEVRVSADPACAGETCQAQDQDER